MSHLRLGYNSPSFTFELPKVDSMQPGHAILIAYCVVAFLALTLAGLMVLQRQKGAVAHSVVFVLFAIVCVYSTLWINRRFMLLMGEAAIAWVVALLLAGAIVAITRAARRARVTQ